MNIAIDARFYGLEHTGLGRYTTNVMTHLPTHLQGLALKVLLRKKYYDALKLPKNCEKVLADFPHYSLAEQILLPRLLEEIRADLLYSLHFNVPVRIQTPFVVTVHDLIKTHFDGRDTTTRNPLVFKIKRWAYDRTIRHAITAAHAIIVPTNTVKNDILAAYNADPGVIHPIAEAPDAIFRNQLPTITSNYHHLPIKYLLYVGNAYPHKNMKVLLEAMTSLPQFDLVIVSKRTPFLEKVLQGYDTSRIHVLSELSDQDLAAVYKRAHRLVTPSLMEGYCLTGIEALMVGTPVIASNIPVYREVYGGNVTYFNPHSANSLVAAVKKSKKLIHPIKFDRNWDDVAVEIAEVIREASARL